MTKFENLKMFKSMYLKIIYTTLND